MANELDRRSFLTAVCGAAAAARSGVAKTTAVGDALRELKIV